MMTSMPELLPRAMSVPMVLLQLESVLISMVQVTTGNHRKQYCRNLKFMVRQQHPMLVLNPHEQTGPILRRKDSTTQYRKERAGPASTGVEQLVLLLTWGSNSTGPDWLNQLLPRPTYRSLICPPSTSILSMTILSVWRDRFCRTMAAGSPWLW